MPKLYLHASIVDFKGQATLGRLIYTSADNPKRIQSLSLTKIPTRAWGALAQFMRRGLFATNFGPSHYQCLVDRADPRFAPAHTQQAGVHAIRATTLSSRPHRAAWLAYVLGTTSLAASVVRFEGHGIASLSTVAIGTLSIGLGYWLWHRANTDNLQT
jgi:hypothetical protein